MLHGGKIGGATRMQLLLGAENWLEKAHPWAGRVAIVTAQETGADLKAASFKQKGNS